MLHYDPRRDGLVILIPGCCLAALREPLGAPLLLAKRSCRPVSLLVPSEKWVPIPNARIPGCGLAHLWQNHHPKRSLERVQLRCSQS